MKIFITYESTGGEIIKLLDLESAVERIPGMVCVKITEDIVRCIPVSRILEMDILLVEKAIEPIS